MLSTGGRSCPVELAGSQWGQGCHSFSAGGGGKGLFNLLGRSGCGVRKPQAWESWVIHTWFERCVCVHEEKGCQ